MSADLDKAIDRAVREMLDVEPRADLRARVVARIDVRPASFHLALSGLQRFAVLVGAAAVLVLVLVLARHSAAPPAPPPLVARGGDRPIVVRPPAQSQIDVPAAPGRMAAAASRVVRHGPDGVANAASIDTAPGGAAIDPLKAIAPIEMAPISQSSITPEPIGVHPLDPITEMQIAPLSPPDRRE